ncbi:MAG: PaaI family thioesterase [Acidimicrobiia bacterium]|nr:PaaI family thioesterase [Acidimicrobiia bacterium]
MSVTDPVTGYPPDPHVLRDLGFETERRQDHRIVRAVATPHLADDGRHLGQGVLAILLDVSGASTAIEAVQPDWIATVDLTYHGGPVGLGPVLLDVAPVRVGKNLVVMQARVQAGVTEPDPSAEVGHGLVTFARIPGSATEATLDDRADQDRTALVASVPLSEPLPHRLGITTIDASNGIIEMPHSDYARNSFGTINGGVVGLLCDTAARLAATELLGPAVTTHGLEVHYLAQTRVGPARTVGRVIRADRHGATVRVDVADAGADDTLLAIGVVSVALDE